MVMTELRRTTYTTLAELKETVESFARSMDEEEVRQAVRNIRSRAPTCLKKNGAAFERN